MKMKFDERKNEWVKTLEELGISPTPWNVGDNESDTIYDDDGDIVVDFCKEHDARLMSAAPELYELVRMAYRNFPFCNGECDGCKSIETCDKWMLQAHAALEKAGGDVSNHPDAAKNGDVQ